MSKLNLTIREKILRILARSDTYKTVVEITREISKMDSLPVQYESTNKAVASELYKMTKKGELIRKDGVGKQGGYGYKLKEK